MTSYQPYSATVNVFSHGYSITNMSPKAQGVVARFAERYIDKQIIIKRVNGKRTVNELIGGSYFGKNSEGTEYRFHINTLSDFKAHLNYNNVPLSDMDAHNRSLYTGTPVEFEWFSDKEDRDHQISAIEWITSPGRTRVLALQTGKGKTYCAMRAIKILGVRTMIILRPGYVDRWLPDIQNNFGLDNNELLWISSAPQLINAIEDARAGLFNCKIIVINNTALHRYITSYEKDIEDPDHQFKPEDMLEILGVGLRIIDEVHEFFELNLKLDCYLNCPKSILLSATLNPSNKFLRNIYQIMMPESCRFELEHDKYIAARAIMYSVDNPKRIKCTGFMGMYSHSNFEKSLFKLNLMPNYCNWISSLIDRNFLGNRKPGQRAIVFAASVDMCKEIFKRLSFDYPNLNVKLYVSGSDYATCIQADLIVSTLKSAGTAVDIPGLRMTIMTTSINSDQSNEQVLGRTRNLPDGDTPEFLYLVCKDIPKQVHYHTEKKRIFSGKVISHYEYDSGFVLTSRAERPSNGIGSRY